MKETGKKIGYNFYMRNNLEQQMFKTRAINSHVWPL